MYVRVFDNFVVYLDHEHESFCLAETRPQPKTRSKTKAAKRYNNASFARLDVGGIIFKFLTDRSLAINLRVYWTFRRYQ